MPSFKPLLRAVQPPPGILRELLALIRDPWSAIVNGVHHRGDVSFGEDPCRVRDRTVAEMLATLRNLAIGAYALAAEAGRTRARSLRNWMKGQIFGSAHGALKRLADWTTTGNAGSPRPARRV